MLRIVKGLLRILIPFGLSRRPAEFDRLKGPIRRPDLEELQQRFRMLGLHALWKQVQPHIQSSVRIRAERAAAPVGGSKLGGMPDLPLEFAWPLTPAGVPLAFLGQINLAEIAGFDAAKPLPAEGLLSFFYDDSDFVDPNAESDQGKWRVEWVKAKELRRAPFPDALSTQCRYAERPIRFESDWTLPARGSLEDDLLSRAASDRLSEWSAELFGEEEESNRLLGYADLIQSDPRWDCVQVSGGIYSGSPHWSHWPQTEADRAAALEWVLLAQIDSDYTGNGSSDREPYMCWGDLGRLYFWIHRADLTARRFDRVRLTWDCY